MSELIRRAVGLTYVPLRDEELEERFQDIRRQLSWLRHPDLVKPHQFEVELDVVYCWGPVPQPQSLREQIALQQPDLKTLLGWLQNLCDLVEECHKNSPPLYFGHFNMANLRWREGRPQVVGLTLNRHLQLTFENHDPSWCGPPESEIGASSDCWCLAQLLLDMIAASGSKTKQQLAAHPQLQRLLKQAQDPDPSRRPSRPSVLKAQLERLPPERKVAPRWLVKEHPNWLRQLQKHSQPLLLASLLVTGLGALGWSWSSWQPPKKLPPPSKTSIRRVRRSSATPATLLWGPATSPSPHSSARPD